MGLVNDLGIALGFQNNKVWRLTSLDDAQNKIIGQFQAEGLEETVGANVPETQPVGLQQPALQWQSGETETLRFSARIFRTSPIQSAAADFLANPVGTGFNVLTGDAGPIVGNGSVRDQIEKLKAAARKNDKLGRQERFLFSYGTELEFEVFIRSVGGIKYDDIRSDGTIRGATFDVQLVKLKPENLKQAAGVSVAAGIKAVAGVLTTVVGGAAGIQNLSKNKLIKIPGGSIHTVSNFVKAKQGDTFEKIARKEYGNPSLGDVLRRAQPQLGELTENDSVAVVEKREVVQIQVTPQSVPLKDTTENKLLLEVFLAYRGKSGTVII